jgi:hypothetical protein
MDMFMGMGSAREGWGGGLEIGMDMCMGMGSAREGWGCGLEIGMDMCMGVGSAREGWELLEELKMLNKILQGFIKKIK